MRSVVARFPSSNSAARGECPRQTGPPKLAQIERQDALTQRAPHRTASLPGGDRDRHRRQHPRNDRQQNRMPDAHRAHQSRSQQWANDGACVVTRPLDATRTPVGGAGRDRHEQTVPGRAPDPARYPCQPAQNRDLPDSGGKTDSRSGDGRPDISAGGEPTPSCRVVRQRATSELADPIRASEAPSIAPRAPGPACSVDVRSVGSSEVASS
jgi:hypothetical protein